MNERFILNRVIKEIITERMTTQIEIVDNKYKFKRTIIVKELNAKGKPNIEFDDIKFEEAKIKKTGQKSLFNN